MPSPRIDVIAGADPSDPRFTTLAAGFAAHLPANKAAALVAGLEQAETSRSLNLMTSNSPQPGAKCCA